jgi:alkaline phosphatase
MNRTMAAGAMALAFTATTADGFARSAQPPQSNDSYFKAGQAELARRLAVRPVTGRAKNVILFVGDGMGVSTLTAARIYAGQARGVDGESYSLASDLMPYSALVKTYSHDAQVADSSPTATAMMTGVKTGNGVLGVSQNVADGDCIGAKADRLKTLMEMAEDAGMATGVVTTTTVTHATPGSTYAHSADRDWESDAQLSARAKAEGCADIARQLVEWPHGDGFEVIFGGGRAYLTPKTMPDVENPGASGVRLDGRDLIAEWQARSAKRTFVWNKAGFDALDPKAGRQVMGLFSASYMALELDRAQDKGGEPSLAEMTGKAIALLAQKKTGYVLMVEGGRIDHGHHANNAARALADAVALDDAVRTALAMTNPKDTLIIVTADHSHGLTISGYPRRGNPILGPVVGANGKPMLGRDGKGYTTLNYATGPGAAKDELRRDPLKEDTLDKDYRQSALIGQGAASHAGEDVAVRAIGPQAHLLTGTIEQNTIFHVMAYALGNRLRSKGKK